MFEIRCPRPQGSDKAFWLKKHLDGDGAEAEWKFLTMVEIISRWLTYEYLQWVLFRGVER